MTLTRRVNVWLGTTGDLLLALCGTGLLLYPIGTVCSLWGPAFPLQLQFETGLVLETTARDLWLLGALVLSYPFVARRWSFRSLRAFLVLVYPVWFGLLLVVLLTVSGDFAANAGLVSVLTVCAYGVGAIGVSQRERLPSILA